MHGLKQSEGLSRELGPPAGSVAFLVPAVSWAAAPGLSCAAAAREGQCLTWERNSQDAALLARAPGSRGGLAS